MKIHIGADVNSGAVHTVEITAANEADINVLSKLLRAEDGVVFGDAGYTSDEYKRGSRQLGIRCVKTQLSPVPNCAICYSMSALTQYLMVLERVELIVNKMAV
ncbi:MAG: IS4/IS5 family transposase [Nitrosomonadaceae bacterium]|nr:IS4/IS5 family transposase [Nitrosomonadaceae bacterium]